MAAHAHAAWRASFLFSSFISHVSVTTPNAALHLHRGAVQRRYCHTPTALPGVRCKRLLGPTPAHGPDPSHPTPGGRGRTTWGRTWCGQAQRGGRGRHGRGFFVSAVC